MVLDCIVVSLYLTYNCDLNYFSRVSDFNIICIRYEYIYIYFDKIVDL